jgi:hypothetical protein
VNARDLEAAVARARDLIEFTAGLEEAGLVETARRSRMTARDVLELADALAAERSARDAAVEAYKRVFGLLTRRGECQTDPSGTFGNPFITDEAGGPSLPINDAGRGPDPPPA